MSLEGDSILFAVSTRSSKGDMEPLIMSCKAGWGPYEFYERNPICDDCMVFASNEQKQSCPHTGHIRQPHSNDKKKKTASLVAKILGLSDAHAQENLNIISTSFNKFFPSERIRELFTKENFTSFKDIKPQVIYVGIDPADGGKCYLGGAAFAHYHDKHTLLCGSMIVETKVDRQYLEDATAAVKSFIRQLRMKFPTTPIVVGVETMPTIYAPIFEAGIRRAKIENVFMVYAGRSHVNNGIGLPCHGNNAELQAAYGIAMRMFDGCVKISSDIIITSNLESWGFRDTKHKVLDLCMKQMFNYESTLTSNQKISADGKKNAQQDDFCSAIIKACHTKYFLLNPQPGLIRNIYNMKENLGMRLAPDVSVNDMEIQERNLERLRRDREVLDTELNSRRVQSLQEERNNEREREESEIRKRQKTTHEYDHSQGVTSNSSHRRPREEEEDSYYNPETGREWTPHENLMDYQSRKRQKTSFDDSNGNNNY